MQNDIAIEQNAENCCDNIDEQDERETRMHAGSFIDVFVCVARRRSNIFGKVECWGEVE